MFQQIEIYQLDKSKCYIVKAKLTSAKKCFLGENFEYTFKPIDKRIIIVSI